MSRITRSASHVLLSLFVWLSALSPASAQSNLNRYDYGYCYGNSGNSRVGFVTRTFVLGKQNLGGGHAAYMAELKRRFNTTFPREEGCSMSPTAAEAQAKRQQLIDGATKAMGPQGIVVLDWIPEGATALPGGPGPTPIAGQATANTATAAQSTNAASSQSAYVANMPGPFWACAASANGVQHDSAIFPQPNIFPQQITWEYRNYLSTKYHIGSMPNCESRPTRAEAEAFLAKHAAGTIPGATSVSTQRIATGWIPHQLGGPPIEDVAPPPPPPAPKPHGPTTFYACKSNKESEHTEYTSAAFQAEPGQAAAIGKAFDKYLIGMFGHEGVIECPQFATLAQANDWINQRRMFAIRNHSSIETTHWKYEGAIDGGAANAPAPTSATAGASAVAPPPAPTPMPVTPPPPPKPAVSNATQPKPPAATTGIFVTCNSNSFQDRARYYNSPIQVASGDYAAWMASYQKFLQTNFKYSSGVMCNKQPTLAEAQSYFKEVTDTARLTTKDNLDRPWPVVITNWKYP